MDHESHNEPPEPGNQAGSPPRPARDGAGSLQPPIDDCGPGLRRFRRVALQVFCGLFLVLLWLPLLDSVFGLDHSPAPGENREPAAFPALSPGLSGLKKYFAGLEAYYNDHFGFRKLFIHAHAYLQRKVFYQGNADVLIGRDRWLYFVAYRAVDSHLGLRPLTPEQLQTWQELLETRRDWLAARGIKYLFVIAPNKESIYPEYLPDWANNPGAVTQLDQFLAYMRAHSTVPLLDLRPTLLEARKHAHSYSITDSHWNQFGAFAAYQDIIRTLGRQLPGIDPLPLAAFDTNYTQLPGGDLAKMLAQEQAMPERNYITLTPRPPLQALAGKVDPSIFPNRWRLDERPLVIENPDKEYRAVVFRDSFSTLLTPFLGFHFKRVVFIWQREWERSVIERERPDVVIDEMLERYFDSNWPIPTL